MAQTIITSPFTENRMVISVTHTSHGFDSGDLGKPMRSSGVNGRFVVAQADSATNAEVVGVLTSVEDVNNYTITSTGIVDVAEAIPDAATAGQVLFVSQTADTVLTTTEPTAVGQVSKPVAVIIEQNAKMLLIHYRGEVITSTTQTNAPNDATYVTTTSNSSLSNEVLTSALKIDDFAAGDDNTDLDSSTSRHGLLRKLDGTTTNFLRGDGAWAAAGSNAFTNDVTVTSGNIVMATAGKGIDFSATANSSGSMSSELLDWYEEGTFTPTIADNDLNASESQAYHTQVGRYVRIGRMVHCHITLHTSSIGNLTTSHGVKILGLPFSSLNSGATVGGGSVYIATSMSLTSGTSITVDVPANVAYCRLQNFDASSGTSTFLLSEWGGTGNILLSLTYEAA